MTARAAKILRDHKVKKEISKATKSYGSLPYEFHKRYSEIFGATAAGHNHSSNITHLAKVCLVDPFPKEDEELHICE